MEKAGCAFQAQYDDTMDYGERNKRNSHRSSASAVNVQESSNLLFAVRYSEPGPYNKTMKCVLNRIESATLALYTNEVIYGFRIYDGIISRQ